MDRDLTLDVIRAQLAVAKNSLAATHMAIATIERILETEVPDTATLADRATAANPASDAETPPGLVTEDTCDHPRGARMRSAVMGKPNRWRCTACGGEFDE